MKRNMVLFIGVLGFTSVFGWEVHPLFSDPIFRNTPEVSQQDSVPVVSLQDFLVATEDSLVTTLKSCEDWAQSAISWYKPVPDDLVFSATGDRSDIIQRFEHAIRINLNSKFSNYIQLLPGAEAGTRPTLPAEMVTPAQNTEFLNKVTFVLLDSGELVDPLSVLVTATDEPDHALDVGLFEDNHTVAGAMYGFGIEPFGNPSLEYGSQAPFHMGFFHEAKLVNKLAPYIQESYIEYRIQLYRALSEMAFRMGQDYWGWRFMGWGLHYLADLVQPYHACALPGTSTIRMITINTLNLLGFSRMKDQAIQLVSNRHTALEVYERQVMEEAYQTGNGVPKFDWAKFDNTSNPVYTSATPRQVISEISARNARKMDKLVASTLPDNFVNDPTVEIGNHPDLYNILAITRKDRDRTSTQALDNLISIQMHLFATYGRAYVRDILGK